MQKPKTIESLKEGELCYVLLPGESGGLHHPLIQLVYQRLSDGPQSVVAMEYPFQTRGDEPPKNDLSEEIDATKHVLADLNEKGYQKFIFICKSLGGIVATWLIREQECADMCEGIYIFGCVRPNDDGDGIDVAAAKNKLRLIIQGELDPFGSPDDIREYLRAYDCPAEVVGIKDGDHSYRHKGSRELPTHEPEAVDELFRFIG